jgi:ABC-type siderophore export system fused ATPase/permease subunit
VKRFSNIYVILIITFYVLFGFFVYSDYGISWDEAFQHDYGKVVYEHVFHDSKELSAHRSRYHGPIFQLALYSSEKVLGVTDIGNVFRLRHLLTFLFSAIGLVFFYRLLRELKFSQFWSAVGLLFLIGSPRIFAHSFYNSKDVVFM